MNRNDVHNDVMTDRHSHKPYPLRMPEAVRDRLEAAATASGRSLNAEIVRRLEASLHVEPMATRKVPEISGDIPFVMAANIADMAKSNEVSFDEMLARIFVAGMNPDAPQVLYLQILPGATTKELRAALEASKNIALPNATIVSEMVANRPSTKSQVIADDLVDGDKLKP